MVPFKTFIEAAESLCDVDMKLVGLLNKLQFLSNKLNFL